MTEAEREKYLTWWLYESGLDVDETHRDGDHVAPVGTYEEMESRSSSNTSAQTMTITSRLIAILSSIPRQGPTVTMVAP